jgi:beta-aspartyl-peptidase (threonine type)
MKKFAIAIHGGAGTILPALMTPEKELLYRNALKAATEAGLALLSKGASSLDAVEAAVMCLEDFPLFNAGKGAVFTNAGTHEMDASIMEGLNLEAGAVSGVSHIKNPIQLARLIKEKSGHVYLSGLPAEQFAQSCGMALEPTSYFYTEERYKQWQQVKDSDTYQLDHSDKVEQGEKKFGTVGAVALDQYGNLAAATSTGGMTNKRFGRVGDTPIIGAGTYANNATCAISCTGHGEFFMRAVVAYDISCLMAYKGLSLQEACRLVVNDKLVKMGGEGGLVAIDSHGNIALPFNSEGMYRAWASATESVQTAIYKD